MASASSLSTPFPCIHPPPSLPSPPRHPSAPPASGPLCRGEPLPLRLLRPPCACGIVLGKPESLKDELAQHASRLRIAFLRKGPQDRHPPRTRAGSVQHELQFQPLAIPQHSD